MDAYLQEVYDLFLRDEIGSAEMSLLLVRHKVELLSSRPPKPDTLAPPPPPEDSALELHEEDFEVLEEAPPSSKEFDLLRALASGRN